MLHQLLWHDVGSVVPDFITFCLSLHDVSRADHSIRVMLVEDHFRLVTLLYGISLVHFDSSFKIPLYLPVVIVCGILLIQHTAKAVSRGAKEKI